MIDWGALGLVAVTTLLATVAVVGVVSVGILALTRADQSPRPAPALRLSGYACLVAGACVVLFGIYLIVPQFH